MRAAEVMVRHATGMFEARENIDEQANIAKMMAADVSWTAAEVVV